ncbi:hypothetical protein ACLQ25_09360 [Micromonospora sp. DT44]|uniref:hypothetical protein n=1 Tax=Micromonospora sp. DT44 TaxID=3393439 RepID=UPI003CF10F1E
MHHHRNRTMLIAGCVTGTAALVLLALLAMYAYDTEHPPVTARYVLLVAVDLLLGATTLRLLASALERGHVEGVRETVNRLAAALPKGQTGQRQ